MTPYVTPDLLSEIEKGYDLRVLIAAAFAMFGSAAMAECESKYVVEYDPHEDKTRISGHMIRLHDDMLGRLYVFNDSEVTASIMYVLPTSETLGRDTSAFSFGKEYDFYHAVDMPHCSESGCSTLFVYNLDVPNDDFVNYSESGFEVKLKVGVRSDVITIPAEEMQCLLSVVEATG